MRANLAVVFVVLCALSGSARAQVPPVFNQEGVLVDANGAPLSGPVTLRFSLYAAADLGAAVWTEEKRDVPLVEGYYSVLLGEVVPLTPAIVQQAPFLGLNVNGSGELRPRIRLSSVPFALVARNVAGGTVDATGVFIAGRPVIDNQGRWVGDPSGLQGPAGPAGPGGPAGPPGPAGGDGSPDTPEQVRAKLVQVDGAGSGIDADLLDGLSSAAFLRADRDTRTTGSLTVDGGLVAPTGAFGGVRANDVLGHTYLSLMRADRNVEVGLRYLTGGAPDWWVFLDNNALDNDLRLLSPGAGFSDRAPQVRLTAAGDVAVGRDVTAARDVLAARVVAGAGALGVTLNDAANHAYLTLRRADRTAEAGFRFNTGANTDWWVFTDNDATDADLRFEMPGQGFTDRLPQMRIGAAGDLFAGRHVVAGGGFTGGSLGLASDGSGGALIRVRSTIALAARAPIVQVDSPAGAALFTVETNAGRGLPGMAGSTDGLDVYGSGQAVGGELRLAANRGANTSSIGLRPNRIDFQSLSGGAAAETYLSIVGPTGRVGVAETNPGAQLHVTALRNEILMRQARANAGSYDQNVANNLWTLGATGGNALITAEGAANRVHIPSLVLPPQDAAPQGPVVGQIYNDRAQGRLLVWNGQAWVALGGGGGGGGGVQPAGRTMPGFQGDLGPDLSAEGYSQCYGWVNNGQGNGLPMDRLRQMCGDGERVVFAGRRCDGSNVRHDMTLRQPLGTYLVPQEIYFRDFDVGSRYSFNTHPQWLVLNQFGRNWQDPGRLWEPYVGAPAADTIGAYYGHVLSQAGNNAHDQGDCLGDAYYVYMEPPAARPAEPVPQGLVGHWPLDGSGRDVSGNGLHGSPEGGLIWAAGRTGQAAQIDANDDAVRVRDAGPSALDVRTVTMAAWVFPFSCDVPGDRGIIMNKENTYEWGLEDNTCNLQGAFAPCWRWWGAARVEPNRWNHVAIVFDGAREIHYINGVRRESDACAGVLAVNDEDFKIGSRNGDGGNGSDFNGLIDEAYLWGRALGDNEIALVFAGGGGGADLGTAQNPGTSCKVIKDARPDAPNGLYTLDTDGPGGQAAFPAYCDMTTRGGGWTLLVNHDAAAGYFGDEARGREFNAGDPQAALYSILGRVDQFRRNGEYEIFYWNRQFDRQVQSAQTSSPLEEGRRGGCAANMRIIGANYQPELFCGYTPGPAGWTSLNGYGPNWTHAAGQFRVYADWPLVCTHNSGYHCNHIQFYIR